MQATTAKAREPWVNAFKFKVLRGDWGIGGDVLPGEKVGRF
jgi:hypothetical protein